MSTGESIEIVAERVGRMACGKCNQLIEVSDRPWFSEVECPHCGTMLKVPAQFGPFLLIEPLGAGGMGAVYRGYDPALGRFVAIKVMKPQLGEDPELIASFLREARAAAALNHPNIVQIYSCGQEHAQPYIVMELVGGGRLDQLMADGRTVEEVRLLQITLDVSEGLKAANGAGLVHGDIKPANILFDQSGTAKVVDFGLAQFVNRQQEQGGVWGTPFYISPERARGGKADHRSDIYSLGATMFHALTGQPPFDGTTAQDVVVARLKGPPPRVRDLVPALQPETDAVIHRMMSPDPVTRYPTSASLQADLRASLSAANAARSISGRAKKKKGPEWAHLVVIGGSILALLAAGFFVIRWFLRSEPIPPPAVETRQPTNETATADDGGDGLVARETPSGKLQLGIDFFTAEAETNLVQMASILATNPAGYALAIDAFASNVPPRSARLMWVRLFQALPKCVAGDDTGADELVRGVAAIPITQRRGHPVYMPQVLARHMIGDLDDARLAKESEGWPAWYADAARFFAGAAGLRGANADAAASKLEAYAASEKREPAWVYGFQPAARAWLDDIAAARARLGEVRATLTPETVDGAEERIAAAVAATPPLARFVLAPLSNDLAKVRAQIAEQKRSDEEAARQAAVARDREKTDGALAANRAVLIEERQYKRVSQALDRLERDLETDDGRAYLAAAKARIDRLEGLKTLLIENVANDPFTAQDPELGGPPLSASMRGIRVSLSGQGTITKPWEQISPRLFMRLLVFYASRPHRTPAERGDIFLSLAVLSELHGARDTTIAILKQALLLNPDLAFEAARLLPDVPVETGP